MQQAPAKEKQKSPLAKFGWGPLAAILITCLAYVASQVILAVPIFFISGSSDNDSSIMDASWVGLVLSGVAATGLLFTLWIYLKFKKLKFRDLGFRKIKFSDIGWTLLASLIYLFLVAIVSGLVSNIPGFDSEQAQDVGYKGAEGWQLILAFIGLVIIPPIAEEMLFRGFLYRGLANNKWDKWLVLSFSLVIAGLAGIFSGSWVAPLVIFVLGLISTLIGIKFIKFGAAIFTSLMFGIVHMQWNVGVDVFVLSLVLIALYEKTKNLWASIFLHAIKNCLAFMFLFVFAS